MKTFDVIIIGAGASGLMCAIEAAKRGRRVLVLEKSNKPGKKILMSGGGRCNFTNMYVEPENFISHNPHFCKSALSQYTQWDFIAWVNQVGIEYEERDHGQLFCVHSAKDILNMLLDECEQHDVSIRLNELISEVGKQEDSYEITSNSVGYTCESLVVASGGLSIPTLGSSGFGYELAEQFGLRVYDTTAGLVPFTFSDYVKNISQRLSGVAIDVEISAANQSFKEALLFTHRGLSGPAVLQISNYWRLGEQVTVNLLPEYDLAELLLEKKQTSKVLLQNFLSNYLPKSLVQELQALFWAEYASKPLAEYANQDLLSIAQHIHAWKIKPSGTEGYRTAEVTLGGVDTDCFSSQTMMCKSHAGLYFIGEVLDVTGHLGGFNFQWAWSSAYVAGQYV